MSEPALFDMDPVAPAEPQEKLSKGRRRTLRQAQALKNGRHPLGLGGMPIPLHPDAPDPEDRSAPGPRCGTCALLAFSRGGNGTRLKCTREIDGRRPFVTHGPGTDARRWWPACRHWVPAEEEGGAG